MLFRSEQAARLMRDERASATVTEAGEVIHWSWDAHHVRHVIGERDALRWLLRVGELEQRGYASVSCYVSPTDDTMWEAWQDRPTQEWGSCSITSTGVLWLAEIYGTDTPDTQPWHCEDCLCSCGAEVVYPQIFCVACVVYWSHCACGQEADAPLSSVCAVCRAEGATCACGQPADPPGFGCRACRELEDAC